MRLSDLQDHDYQVLEDYWFDFKEIATEKSDYEPRQRHLKNVVGAIERLYNESDGVTRELIEQGYFNPIAKQIDNKYMAKELGVTQTKLSRVREGLMQETAELIGFV